MKKKNLLGALICAAAMAVTSIAPTTVMADATKVVTLGADLSDAQKSTMMKYFKVNRDEVQVLYVTNQDERHYLSSYIPSAQIGTRTVSCAYVKPTGSGGIKVRTANLNYVTCNMIASTLSTSGVSNCEVVAACPFEVSGTGALTGIMMAYEKATGEELDPVKKDIATHEMVVTGNLAESIESNKDAINIINSGKMEVVGNDIQNAEEIQNVVINIAQENNIDISKEQLDEIVSLLEEIAHQDYKYEDMKETLENVEENVSDNLTPSEEPTGTDAEWTVIGEEEEDSILADLDASVLGEEVLESSTEDPTLEIETGLIKDGEEWEIIDDGDIWQDPSLADNIESDEWDDGFDTSVITEEDELNTDMLTDEQKEKFEHLKNFLKGELGGDVEALQKEMEEEIYPTVYLDEVISDKLTTDILKVYLDLLKEGTDDYVMMEMDEYFTPELNILARELKETLNMDGYAEPESYLETIPSEERETIYKDLMKFFEKLYDEITLDDMDATWNEYAGAEETSEGPSVDDGWEE